MAGLQALCRKYSADGFDRRSGRKQISAGQMRRLEKSGDRTINETEAAVIRRIFADFE
jgi:hypothetical protein